MNRDHAPRIDRAEGGANHVPHVPSLANSNPVAAPPSDGNLGGGTAHVSTASPLSTLRRAYRKAVRNGLHAEAKRLRWLARKVTL